MSESYEDFLMDFETLGTEDSAVLLSVGVMKCPKTITDEERQNPILLEKYTLHFKIDREEQIKNKRTIDKDTIEWWKKQNIDAKNILTNSNCYNSKTIYNELLKFFTDAGFDAKKHTIWSRGLIDQRWWQSYCRTFNFYDFLPFWCWRDTRTLLDVLTNDPNGNIFTFNGLVKHNSSHDCILDFIRMISVNA